MPIGINNPSVIRRGFDSLHEPPLAWQANARPVRERIVQGGGCSPILSGRFDAQ